MKTRLQPLLGILTLVILAAVWWQIWREPIWAVDDLYFGKRSLNAAGQLDWGILVSQIPGDLMVRNGRIADIYGELIFATGNAKSLVLLALMLAMHTAIFAAADRLVATAIGRTPRLSVRIFLGVCAACFPFLLLWRQPAITGTTLLFMSATIGYFGGVIFLGTIIVLSADIARREVSTKRQVAIIALVILAGLHHEILALMVAAWWAAIWFTADHRNLPRRNNIIIISAFALSLARFALPGLWQRNDAVSLGFAWPTTPGPLGKAGHQLLKLASYAAHFAIEMLVVFWPFVLGFAVAAAALIWRALRSANERSWRRVIPALIIGATLVMLALARRLRGRRPTDRTDAAGFYDLFTSKTFAAFLLVVIVLVVAYAACWTLRRELTVMYGLLAITAGASAIPAALASVYARPTFFVAVMVVFAPIVLVAVWMERTRLVFAPLVRIGVLAVTTLVALTISWQMDREILHHHRENLAVWRNIEAQIRQVQHGDRTGFELPQRLPAPQYLPDYIGSSVNGGEYIIGYYHLPEDTMVHTPPTAETTAAN